MRIFVLLMAVTLLCPHPAARAAGYQRGVEPAKRNLALEREALTQRDKIEGLLPPAAKQKLEVVFEAFLRRLLRDKKPVDAGRIVKEELARQFPGLSPKQAHLLTFYVVTGVIRKVPPAHAERQAERDGLRDKKDSISEMSETDMLMLQQMMEKKNQLESMISNLVKAGFEGGQAALQTLKAS